MTLKYDIIGLIDYKYAGTGRVFVTVFVMGAWICINVNIGGPLENLNSKVVFEIDINKVLWST